MASAPKTAAPKLNPASQVSFSLLTNFYYVDGVAVDWMSIPRDQWDSYSAALRAQYTRQTGREAPGINLREDAEAAPEVELSSDVEAFNAATGLSLPDPSDPRSVLMEMLRAAGADTEHPEVQAMVQGVPTSLIEDESLLRLTVENIATNYPSTVATSYSRALEDSGFDTPEPRPTLEPGTTALPGVRGLQLTEAYRKKLTLETQDETGWLRFSNGVLVSPDGGPPFYEPGSDAPGSTNWRLGISNWSEAKILEWKQTLHEYGYLSKADAKGSVVDTNFLAKMQEYQNNRYLNGGTPLVGDASLASGSGSPQPKLVDFNDMAAQIRNDVREQYERVYGVRPTDGQVATWSNYIINTGMALQRKYRSKDYGSYTSLAATEAEEMFIEKIEGSPEGTFLRESDEENTKLHDALSRAVQVTGSLA